MTTTTTPATFTTVDQVRRANAALGHHFFDAATLRFFSSRILEGVYGGTFFVTSERFETEPRRYTVRIANADGSVDTLGEHGQYRTADAARRAAQAAADELAG